MRSKLYLLILCFIACLWCTAQDYKPVLTLKEHNREHLSEYYTYWLQPFDQPESVILADSAFQRGAFVHWKWHKSISLGDIRQRLWVRIVVTNADSGNVNFVYSIHDFLDTATLFLSNGERFTQVATGTYWDIASRRLFPSRPLCLPFKLSFGQKATLYLSIDQHNNNLYFPLHIRSAADLLQEEQRFIIDQRWFWLVGFYLFSIVFNLILFSFLRDRIYLWYCLYVLFNTAFLLMEDSLDGLILPQWMYSFIWHMGQYSFLLLSTATGIKVMQVFTSQRIRQPIFYIAGQVLFGISFGFALFTFVLQTGFPAARLVVINFIKTGRDCLIIANLAFILVSLSVGLYRRSRIAAYYGITYFFFFFSCMMFMLNHLGVTSINLVEPNILAWGLLFELLTLSVLLTGRFRSIIRRSLQLQMRNVQLERDQVQTMLETQESERKRIAADLHDDVGPTLSALLLHVSNLPDDAGNRWPELTNYFTKATALSTKAVTDVRNISHNLLPKDFTELGLFQVLENRMEELNGVQNIQFYLFFNGEEKKFDPLYSISLYRIINELVGNILKHSQASEATIEVLIDTHGVELIVGDNGIGMENAVDRKGIGLKNIRSRVDFLKGAMNVETGPAGTKILINIPMQDHGRDED